MKVRLCECGRQIRRSRLTGILWKRCYRCRYLIMIYGPSIVVKIVNDEETE